VVAAAPDWDTMGKPAALAVIGFRVLTKRASNYIVM